ncbi:glycosyltransferase family 2 protein [Gordonia sp. NPDC057258]|uniref:glycosyltransferase family 2 protein n=1 Tax=unclassified Gordonia (in: high G+C Gram-positive bacteria) TaxID=2657482 RepID=UPI0036395134
MGDITTATAPTMLAPVRRTDGEDPVWPGAIWVGQVEHGSIPSARIPVIDGTGFAEARFLVWRGGQPLGFVQVPLTDGAVDGSILRARVADLPRPSPPALRQTSPGVSVVICTRDRPNHLARLLSSLVALDYPEFEIVVVDNNPASGLTRPVVEAASGVSVRVVDAVGQGLSIARNVGVRHAIHDIIAFTDDDVVIDARWLDRLVVGFERDDRVACVCGMVPSVEVLTPSQAWFDHRVGWARRWEPALYGLDDHAADDALFPLRVSEFGTGANFAVRRSAVTALGGFDEALGAGAPAGSGEDMDIFVRILLTGSLLAREPAAIVWHSHRETVAELDKQMHDYGVGLSALLVKMLVNPRTSLMVVKRLVVGVRHLGAVTEVEHDAALSAEPGLATLRRRELAGIARGPWRLVRGRIAGRSGAPLRTRRRRVTGFLDFRREQMWGDAGNSILAGRLARVAVWCGTIGALAATGVLPGALQALAVVVFVLAGPGSVVVSFSPDLPGSARWALVPTVGAAVCTLSVTALLMAGLWNPSAVLAGLGLLTAAGGLARGRYLASRVIRR